MPASTSACPVQTSAVCANGTYGSLKRWDRAAAPPALSAPVRAVAVPTFPHAGVTSARLLFKPCVTSTAVCGHRPSPPMALLALALPCSCQNPPPAPGKGSVSRLIKSLVLPAAWPHDAERGGLTGGSMGCRAGFCHGLRDQKGYEVCPWEPRGRGCVGDTPQLCPLRGHQGQGQPRSILGTGASTPFGGGPPSEGRWAGGLRAGLRVGGLQRSSSPAA